MISKSVLLAASCLRARLFFISLLWIGGVLLTRKLIYRTEDWIHSVNASLIDNNDIISDDELIVSHHSEEAKTMNSTLQVTGIEPGFYTLYVQREYSEDARIIIHLDGATQYDKYRQFFGHCDKYSVDYDIIGTSYYPFWTQSSVDELVAM